MPPERKGRIPPPQPQEEPWYKAARYVGEQPAATAYFQAQETVYNTESDISAYRMMLEQIWHVAVLGGVPAEATMQQQLEEILYKEGKPAQLPEDVLVYLFERREQQIQQGSWVEHHYRPGKVVDTRKKGKRKKR